MSIFQDDTLTQGQRLVWFAVQEMATEGVALDNCSQIAGHMDSGRSHVSRALSALEASGWITRESGVITVHDKPQDRASKARCVQEARNRDSEARDSEAHKVFHFPASPLSPKKEYHSTPFHPSTPTLFQEGGDAKAPPLWIRDLMREISWQAEPLPDDHPVFWDHLPGDWTFDFAAAAMEHFREYDLLSSPTERKIDRDGEDRVIAEWADTFRLLKEQDDYTIDDIRETMEWLFQGRNFWIRNQAIRSVPPLRSKIRSGDAYKFDVMHQQANSDTDEQTSRDAKQRPEENWERLARAAAAA